MRFGVGPGGLGGALLEGCASRCRAELRRVQAQLKDAQTAPARAVAGETLMAGDIRRFKVERDEALRELDVLRNEHRRASEVRRSAQGWWCS